MDGEINLLADGDLEGNKMEVEIATVTPTTCSGQRPPRTAAITIGSSGGSGPNQFRFVPMDCDSVSPVPSFYNANRGSLDLQEKVSVRLVENKGLVVELEDAEASPSPPQCASARARLYSFISESLPAVLTTSPDFLSDAGGGKCPDCNGNKDTGIVRMSPFTKARHGSAGGAGLGVSSMTPLMMKENHKIEVTIKRAPSYIKRHGSSSIHLCCALVFGFVASLFYSLTLLLAKVLHSREHHPVSIAFWRYLGILLPSIPLALFYLCKGGKQKIYGAVWPLNDMEKAANALALLMRAVLGTTAVILRFSSLNYLTIADSSAISYCAPVLAAVVAPFCLKKEKKGILIPLFTGVLVISGLCIICRPPFLQFGIAPGGTSASYDMNNLKGTFLAGLSTVCTAGVILLLRNLLEKVHFSLMVLVLGLWGTFESGVMAFTLGVLKVPELLPDIVMLTGLAVLTFFGQLSILLAMRMGRFGSVSVMRSCDIFLAFLWQYLFLKTEPDIYAILSGILIIFAVWFISFRKWVTTLRSNDKLRKKLSFILL